MQPPHYQHPGNLARRKRDFMKACNLHTRRRNAGQKESGCKGQPNDPTYSRSTCPFALIASLEALVNGRPKDARSARGSRTRDYAP